MQENDDDFIGNDQLDLMDQNIKYKDLKRMSLLDSGGDELNMDDMSSQEDEEESKH